MNDLWDKIVANRQWIFDGCGVAVFVAVIGYVFKRRNKAKQQQKSGSGSINLQAGNDIHVAGQIRKDK
jgi:hypothetical protein